MKSPAVIETLEVAKQDGRGRRLARREERAALIVAFAQSGLTQQAFAQREGINRFTLATWIRKSRLQEASSQERLGRRFVEVAVPRSAGFSLEVIMADGVVVRGHDGEQLAVLVRRLR